MAKPPVEREDAVDSFLQKVAETPVPTPRSEGGSGRLVFAMDATASREATWDRACHLQSQMFEETARLGGLDVQLVFYRGFGECRASRWASDAPTLHRLMAGVHCRGGQTQIGKVLDHVKRAAASEKVDALVFIGDAMEENIDILCHKAGEIGLLGVPAFMFQEDGDPAAERTFREIARLTGGAWCPFDAASAQQLRELLSAVAVYAAGGRRAMLEYAGETGGGALQMVRQIGYKGQG